MIVLEHADRQWVVPVRDVHGIHEFDERDVEPVPVTVSQSPTPFTRGLVRWRDRRIGVLDGELLLSAIARKLA
jgi:chemotaxis-related protein WspD